MGMKLFSQSPPSPTQSEFERTHLLRQLNETSVPLVILQAPIGYGKTTLAAQYVRQSPCPYLWLDLKDRGVEADDLARAIVRPVLDEMARRPGPADSAEHPHLLDVALLLEQRSAENAGGLNLVLDHTRNLSKAVFDWLRAIADQHIPGLRVLVCGYTFPHLALRKLTLQRSALILTDVELAFSDEELALNFPKQVRRGDECERWPSAVISLGRSPQGQHFTLGLLRDTLQELDLTIREHLSEVGVLYEWSEIDAQKIGIDLPHGWVSELMAHGLPLYEVGAGSWRPHPSLRELLLVELQASQDRLPHLLLSAAKLYEKKAKYSEAVQCYLQLGEVETALALAGQLVKRWEAMWEPQRIAQLLLNFELSSLPSDLTCSLALALVDSGKRMAGEAILQQQQVGQRGTPRVLYALCVAAARRGDHATQLRLAEEGLALASDDELTHKLRRAKATALLGMGEYATALAETMTLIDQHRGRGDAAEVCSLLLVKESIQSALGLYLERDVTLQQALAIASDLNLGGHIDIINIYLAENQMLKGDSALALRTVEHMAADLDKRNSIMFPFALELRGEMYRMLGQPERSVEDLRAALTASHTFRIDGLYPRLHAKLAEGLAHMGEWSEADISLNIAHVAVGEHVPAPLEAVLNFYSGVFAFLQQSDDRGRQYFEQALENKTFPHRYVARSRLYLAQLERREGRSEQGQSWLKLISPHDTKYFSVAEQEALNVHGRIVQPLTVTVQAEGASSHLDSTPGVALEITTVGKFATTINQSPVRISSAKTRELLTFLAIQGECRREVLVEALWDGSDEKRHVDHLKLLIRRLRSSLTAPQGINFNPIPYTDGYYSLSKEFELKLDIEHLIQERGDQRTGIKARADLAVSKFMQGTYTEWVSELRRSFVEQTLEAFIALASEAQASDPLMAAQYYRRAIALDPLLEQPYVLLINLLIDNDQRTAAETIYRLYAKMLEEELGLPPPEALKGKLQSHPSAP